MKHRILVSGANGQLGSEIRMLSKDSPHEYIFIDIDDLDLTSSEETLKFLEERKPDYIVNCAAYTAVDRAESDRDAAFAINAEVPALLATYSKSSACKIIHISTDYVFPGEGHLPLTESDKVQPKSVYGSSKLAGEEALRDCKGCITIRTSWLYSSYGNNFVKSMLRLFREKEELGIVFDQVSTPTYGADLAKAILHIIDSESGKFVAGIYHYSNEGVASWYDFAIEILQQSGESCRVKPILTEAYPLPAPRPHFSVLNKDKIKAVYDIEIPHWKISLETCLAILKKNTK